MWLHRTTTPSEVSKSSDSFQANHRRGTVIIPFSGFGGGPNQASDFEVEVHWPDVQSILDELCELAHPEAIAIREALKLVAAAKELGWQAPS
jgi:hypothetical protein